MVQEIGGSSVPDELYNLTQLAEVTLAAGKLSTTNIQQIKSYIQQTADTDRYYQTNDYYPAYPTPVFVQKVSGDIIDDYKTGAPTIPANWKNYWTENGNSDQDQFYLPPHNIIAWPPSPPQQQHHHHHHHHHHDTNNKSVITHSVIKYEKRLIQNEPSPQSVGGETSTSATSSDDDSIFSYSHKIFDRKKSRGGVPHIISPPLSTVSSDDQHEESNVVGVITKNAGNDEKLDESHICPECGKKYSTSSNLARHRQTHRSLQDKKARKCEFCEKVYVSMPAYSMHVRTHNQGCKCMHCGKCFSRPWLLQGHIRTHTGEKPFKCSVCNKAFADKSNLRAHIQTHSNTKPHACIRCGKAFALKSYLYKHEESSCMKNHRGKPSKEDHVDIKLKSQRKTKKLLSPVEHQNVLFEDSEDHSKKNNCSRQSVIRKTVIAKAFDFNSGQDENYAIVT